MLTDQTILIINITCITFLVVMMVVLIAATRMKGGVGWAAIVMASTTIPAYLANTMRTFETDGFLVSFHAAVALNVLCFPALWFFVRSQYEKSFRFTWKSTLHLLPVVVSLGASLLFYLPMSPQQLVAEVAFMEDGNENLPAIINDVLVFGQFFIYFIAMFIYIRRCRKSIRDYSADSEYLTLSWIPNFLILFFVLFFIVFVAYVINPRTDAWLIPILNSVGMAYLVYNIISHASQADINRLPEISKEKNHRYDSRTPSTKDLSEAETAEMNEICRIITDYLITRSAYTNPDFSLAILSNETGIHHKNISKAINGSLRKNFFELVNGMRVEEAKKRLLALSTSDYTIESIYTECGFRSRSTFFMTFKRFEGTSPAQWLKKQELIYN